MSLTCAFWALPASSLRLVWQASYGAPTGGPHARRHLDSGAAAGTSGSTIVLYDSLLGAANNVSSAAAPPSGGQKGPADGERPPEEEEEGAEEEGEEEEEEEEEGEEAEGHRLALFAGRLLVHETRNRRAGVLKQSRLVIRAARQEDSAR